MLIVEWLQKCNAVQFVPNQKRGLEWALEVDRFKGKCPGALKLVL